MTGLAQFAVSYFVSHTSKLDDPQRIKDSWGHVLQGGL